MSCNYAVTAYKPTAVTAVLTANFTAENELNLIVIKANNLVVNLVTPEGLKPVVDVNVNGRISLAKLIRPKVTFLVWDILISAHHSADLHFFEGALIAEKQGSWVKLSSNCRTIVYSIELHFCSYPRNFPT